MLWNILEHGNHWEPLPWTKQMLDASEALLDSSAKKGQVHVMFVRKFQCSCLANIDEL